MTHTPEFREKVRGVLDWLSNIIVALTACQKLSTELRDKYTDQALSEIETLLVEMIEDKRKTYGGTYYGGAIYNQALNDLLAMIRPPQKESGK